ncbi:hypothetical protein [Clostridium sp. JS66]|uniref:hypothetical protein n=1 Tax=Clostridium sp. JS66 TaxID=3064705 RepID=UPI00298DAF61|nr:hypothetical protein [Clostridium sp. JS66]WPC44229.1 hypothetical protein Q6H37_12325 [Clostridium sp. JS66]
MVILVEDLTNSAISFLFIGRTEVEFVDYQKEILAVGLPAFVLYVLVFILTGSIPL